MDAYYPRLLDAELDALMAELPAVSIEGPKGVGKTATGSRRADTIYRLDNGAAAEAFVAASLPFDGVVGTILLDEWQRVPAVWDVVRRAVDDGAPPTRFLLTGSAVPQNVNIHSGAGRIVTVRMRPLSLAERGMEDPTVSVNALGDPRGVRKQFTIAGRTEAALPDYVHEIAASGFPGMRGLTPRVRDAQLDGYIDRVVGREFAEMGVNVRRPETLRGWLRAYAAATATTAAYSTILAAATPGQSDKPAKTTTIIYRDVLAQLWLLDPVPAWLPIGRELTRLSRASKHFLADPALALRLLDISEEDLAAGRGMVPVGAQEGTILGHLFEALVGLNLKVYAQASGASLRHFRTSNGQHEVDFIVQYAPHRLLAVEVKLTRSVSDSDVRHLLWLKKTLGDDLVDTIIVTTGDAAYRRRDGVAVVPAALLGP